MPPPPPPPCTCFSGILFSNWPFKSNDPKGPVGLLYASWTFAGLQQWFTILLNDEMYFLVHLSWMLIWAFNIGLVTLSFVRCLTCFIPQELVFKSKIQLKSPKSQNSRSSRPRILAFRVFQPYFWLKYKFLWSFFVHNFRPLILLEPTSSWHLQGSGNYIWPPYPYMLTRCHCLVALSKVAFICTI